MKSISYCLILNTKKNVKFGWKKSFLLLKTRSFHIGFCGMYPDRSQYPEAIILIMKNDYYSGAWIFLWLQLSY